MASAENVVSKPKWLYCTVFVKDAGEALLFPIIFYRLTFLPLVYNKTITADGAATLPKHTHTRVLEAAASQYFALLSPFSYKKGILILGDQRSSKTYLFFFDKRWQLTKLPVQPEIVCACRLLQPPALKSRASLGTAL